MQQSEGPRPEVHWKVLKCGEVSPYKILVAIFLRENFNSSEIRRGGTPKERIASLMLIYSLINSGDMSYHKFVEHILDPRNHVRPEILRRFQKVMHNLDENNPSFLYDLVNSILDMEAAQTVIMRKKIGRNSPIGKYLRLVLLNLKRMSFPQALYMYQRFTKYIKASAEEVKLLRQKAANEAKSREGTAKGIDLEIDIKMETSDTNDDPPSRDLKIPSATISTTKSDEEKAQEGLEMLQTLVEKEKENAKKEKGDKKALPKRKSLDIFLKMMERRKLLTSKGGLGLDVHNQYKLSQLDYNNQMTHELKISFEKAQKAKAKRISKALSASNDIKNSWRKSSAEEATFTNANVEVESDSKLLESPRSKRTRNRTTMKSPVTPKKSTRKAKINADYGELIVVFQNEEGYAPSEDEEDKSISLKKKGRQQSKKSILAIPGIKFKKSLERESNMVHISSKEWSPIKHWSKKQIEKTLKNISYSLTQMNSSTKLYSPESISSFLEALKFNPSATGLLPQITYMEYVNSLRIKDILRCTESLRTSFDLRIKPHTAELNKGIPYGAYNFAVFYKSLGYRNDSIMFLEEAFRSGHSAGDTTCLHYCHNLWSNFHGKPYTEAIVTEMKEVDKNMAYLHSLNVIANSYEQHNRGLTPEEILFNLWHYNGECDMEEIESSLLITLCSFFCIFGWNHLITVPCNLILYSTLKWPKKIYCGALCLLAQTILLNGDIKLSNAIMSFGEKLFGHDGSQHGELYTKENAYFKALSSYLGYNPVDKDVVCTLAAFDLHESLYWQAYNKIIFNDWEEASRILKKLEKALQKSSTMPKRDLRMRCLLLQAEIECLYKNYQGSLCYLFEAVELSKELYSDSYLSICLVNISAIQTHLGYLKNAAHTLHDDMRGIIRSSCLSVDTRMDLVNIKLRLEFEQPKMNLSDYKNFENILTRAELTYRNWKNEYRLKEVLYVKKKLFEKLEKSIDEEGSGDSNSINKQLLADISAEFENIKPQLLWSPSTCLI